MAAHDVAIQRQATIWTALYGPARAAVMIGELIELGAAEPALDLRAAVDRIDPEEVADYEDFVATRW